MTTEPKTRNVTMTRIFDAPLEQVWQAWSDGEQVKQWWGPMGFTAPLAQMDFREGGTSLVCMQAPPEFGGQAFYNTWTYTKIVPHERFEYIVRFTDEHGNPLDPATLGLPSGIPYQVLNVNVFRDLGNGKTELTITEIGYTTDEAHDISKMGLEQCLDKMAALFGNA